MLCNEASLRHDEETWLVDGDPMEGALLVAALKAGLDPEEIRAGHERVDVIPFDADHRYMATLDRAPDGRLAVSIKGAPERVLQMCRSQAAGDLDPEVWTARIDEAGAEGERVIAAATLPMPEGTTSITPEDLAGQAEFLGLIGLIDPPRPEAITAIADCRSAGISVTMVTGDHAATATAIARQLNIAQDPVVLTGAELDEMDDEAFARAAAEADVLARTSPEHKLRVVRALQAQGRIVAMTGDGVNDAPALKQADVGVAMGHRGTEAAKESSEMVLLDDDFASIVAAIHEGRVVYDNIRKVVSWTLPTNGGEVLTVLAAIIVGFTLPMSPAQILWLNLVLGVTLGLALAFEPAAKGIMARPPRPPGAALLSRFLLWRVVLVSVLFLAGAMAVFGYAHGRGYELEPSRTLVVNALVVMQICYLLDIRHGDIDAPLQRFTRVPRAVLIAIVLALIAQLAFTYAPPLQAVFQTQAVSWLDLAVLLGLGCVLLIVLDVEKRILRRLDLFADSRA